MWKFQDFCISEILHEINFVTSKSANIAVFAILEAMNFGHLVDFSLQKEQKYLKVKIQSLIMC